MESDRGLATLEELTKYYEQTSCEVHCAWCKNPKREEPRLYFGKDMEGMPDPNKYKVVVHSSGHRTFVLKVLVV